MTEWWQNLSLREKRVVFFGAIILLVFLIYFFIWLPFDNSVDALRRQVRNDHDLLIWMKETDHHIQILEKSSQPKTGPRSNASLLSIIQKQLSGTPLVSALTQLHQAEENSVQLSFQKIDFDKLMSWLIKLTEQEDLTIVQMTITPTPTAGVVAADIVLKNED